MQDPICLAQAFSNSLLWRRVLRGMLCLLFIGSGLVGCLSSRTPDVSSIVLVNGPEKIPLRVEIQLDLLRGATERLGTSYSKYGGGKGKVLVAVGDPLGKTLLEGFGRTFLDARLAPELTTDYHPDLLIRPGYRVLSNTSRGQYSGVDAVISLEISDQLGNKEVIETGTIRVRSDGPFRSWKGYVAIPFLIIGGFEWLDADRWAQVTARLGKNAVQELDTRLRTASIVLETVKRKQDSVSFNSDELPYEDLSPAFQRLIEELLAVPEEVPGNVVIGPVLPHHGAVTQWEAFVDEMLWMNFPGSLQRKLVPRSRSNDTLTQLKEIGVDWSTREGTIQYSANVGAYWVLLASTCHKGENLIVHGMLLSRVREDFVRTASMQISKSWRPRVLHLSTGGSNCLED